MARTGRGWDAKPPAPKRRPSSGSRDPDPSAGDEPSAYRGRSLPWSNADEARTAAISRERNAQDGRGGWRRDEEQQGAARGRGARRRNAGEEAERAEESRDPHEIAREICLRQLALRPRTRAELAAVLKKRGVSEEVSSAVLDRYSEVGMIDDAAFAKAWVTSRHHSRGLASRALAQELRRKGVEQEVTESALSELDSETEAQTALDLALRKLRTTRGEPEAVFRRLVGMLARKGYPGGVAVRAVKEALATRDAELADLIDPDAYEETG